MSEFINVMFKTKKLKKSIEYEVFTVNLKSDDNPAKVVGKDLVTWSVSETVTCSCMNYKSKKQCKHTRLARLARSSTTYKIGLTFKYLVIQRSEESKVFIYENGKSLVEEELDQFFTSFEADIKVVSVKALYTQLKLALLEKIGLNHAKVKEYNKLWKKSTTSSDKRVIVVNPEGKIEPGSDSPLSKSRIGGISKPSDKEFYVAPDVWDQCVYGALKGKNVMITGPSGSGKSELSLLVGKAVDKEMAAFNMGAMSDPRTSLIGNVHYSKETGTRFEESRFVRAISTKNSGILLDEMTRSVRAAYNILLPLLDRQRYLALDEAEGGIVIDRAEGTTIFSTANIGMEYVGTDPLDRALRERFGIIVSMEWPPENKEIAILQGRVPKLEFKFAKKLVNIAKVQRTDAYEGNFEAEISTRMLLETAEQVAEGMPFKLAVKFCIQNHFSGSGGEDSDRAKIGLIVQKEAP